MDAQPLRRKPSRPRRHSTQRARAILWRLLSVSMTLGVVLGATGIASASAAPDIDGVWSFGGGKVAVQQLPNGTFGGTVVAATQFATCSHPVGEQMWTMIAAQPDGSYHGLHQWFNRGSQCTVDPQRGLTAWRVLQNSTGARYLRVCFSTPGDSQQPTIAADGTSAHTTYGCSDSALIAALPINSGSSAFRYLTLPSNHVCLSRRAFKIHLHDPKNDPLKQVVVTIKGRRVALARRTKILTGVINLKGLPNGTFTIKIQATTFLGHHISSSRTYHTCKRKKQKRH
jgi:hypothetical protein